MLGRLARVDRSVIEYCLWQCFWVPLRILTCTINFATGGSIYEPFCSRVWRCWVHGNYPKSLWDILYFSIDTAFFALDPDHCWKQYLKTKNRKILNKWSISWLWLTF